MKELSSELFHGLLFLLITVPKNLVFKNIFFSCLGVSNFNSKQIDELCLDARIKPAVLQCESHPYLVQNELINYVKRYGIVCRCPFLFLIEI